MFAPHRAERLGLGSDLMTPCSFLPTGWDEGDRESHAPEGAVAMLIASYSSDIIQSADALGWSASRSDAAFLLSDNCVRSEVLRSTRNAAFCNMHQRAIWALSGARDGLSAPAGQMRGVMRLEDVYCQADALCPSTPRGSSRRREGRDLPHGPWDSYRDSPGINGDSRRVGCS